MNKNNHNFITPIHCIADGILGVYVLLSFNFKAHAFDKLDLWGKKFQQGYNIAPIARGPTMPAGF